MHCTTAMKMWVFFLLLTNSVFAFPDTTSELMEVSGVTQAVDAMPAQMREGLTQGLQSLQLPPEAVDSLISAVDRSLVPEEILEDLQKALSGKMSRGDIETLLAWYQADLGLRITDLESQLLDPEMAARIGAMYESLSADKERVEMAARINELSGGTDQLLSFLGDMQMAMLMPMLGELDSAERDRAMQSIGEEIEKMRPELAHQLSILLSYAYRDLSLLDLETYEAFLATDAARRFNDEVNRTIANHYTGMSREIGEALGLILAERSAS